MKNKSGEKFQELVKICSILRGKNGCLWDKKQTYDSLIPNLKEELDEVINAIQKGDFNNFKEELGDLLYQVIFYSQIASEDGEFNISDVVESIKNKIVRRHPHVFGNKKVSGIKDILENWEKIKKEEKN